MTILMLLALSSTLAGQETQPGGPRHLQLAVANWTVPAWQPAPDGRGELWPFPDETALAVRLPSCLVVGTPSGLLTSNDGQEWTVIPEFYGKRWEPVALADDLLWLSGEDAVTAVDPNDLGVVRHIEGITGQCFAASADGFWCLDGLVHVAGRGSETRAGFHRAHTTVAQYDSEGEEVAALKTGQHLPAGHIYWAAEDPDAIWMLIIDFQRHLRPDDEPAFGRSQMVRLDKTTRASQSFRVPAVPPMTFANRPDSILWFKPVSSEASELIQFEKGSGRTEVLATLPVLWPTRVLADRKHIWVLAPHPDDFLTSRWLAFDLNTLQPVELETIAQPQIRSPLPWAQPGKERPWFRLLASARSRVWLIDASNTLFALTDQGQGQRVHIAELAELNRSFMLARNAARGDSLYLYTGQLIRIQAGQPLAQQIALPARPEGSWAPILGVDDWLWLCRENRRGLIAVRSDLSEVRKIAIESYLVYGDAVAVGNRLFIVSPDGHSIWVADAEWREFRLLRSWATGEPHLHNAQAALTGENIAFFHGWSRPHEAEGAVRRREEQLARVYDSAADQWSEVHLGVGPDILVQAGDHLFGLRYDRVLRWNGQAWEPFTKTPQVLQAARLAGQGIPLGTEAYFYAQTPLGLYRIGWRQFE
jgi:hypothetical protein